MFVNFSLNNILNCALRQYTVQTNPNNEHCFFFKCIDSTAIHRYLWTGPYVAPFILFYFLLRCCPPPLFFFFFLTSTFFHINNILQLSMYHCMTYIQ